MAALNHPNLVKLKSFGHVVVDETSLVYAVMEPVGCESWRDSAGAAADGGGDEAGGDESAGGD